MKMSRVMNRLAGRLALAGVGLLALMPCRLGAQSPEASTTATAGGGTGTNLISGKPGELREEMIRQQLRHDLFRPYNPGQENPLEGMFVQPARPELTPEQVKKLKEMLDQEKYWMFATPDDNAGSNSDTEGVLNDSGMNGDSGMSDYEKDEPKALRRFFDHSSGSRSVTGNTNNLSGLHDLYGQSQDDSLGGGQDRGKIDPASRTAFSSGGPANSIIGQLFQSPSSQDAVHDAGGIGGNGLFSDELSAPVQDDRQHAVEEQHRQAFQEILNPSSSSLKPANTYDPASGLSAAPAGGSSPFGGLNSIDNGGASAALSAPSQEGVSSSVGAASAPASAQPAPASSMMQFEPIEPHQRSF
jgi:hypothetical protein